MNRIHWDQANIKGALVGFFARRSKQPRAVPADGTMYKIQDAFQELDDYWISEVDNERFDATMEHGILYRGDIVAEIMEKVDDAFNTGLICGVLVTGPHGIGKSHSLVNLVLALQQPERGHRELVTFIPDCGSWDCPSFLLERMCGSMGTTMENLVDRSCGGGCMRVTDDDVYCFERIVTEILGELDKRWVLIFDHVDKLFAMDGATKMAGLRRDHRMVSYVRSAGRVVSVLSATTNNDSVKYDGFMPYEHKLEMNEAELKLLFPELAENERLAQDVQGVAGRHPYYVAKYLMDPHTFHGDVYNSICQSVEPLLQCQWSRRKAMESIVQCVLGRSLGFCYEYDQNFVTELAIHSARHSTTYQLYPTMPTVVAAYRYHYWNEIMAYVLDHDRSMLYEAAARRDVTPKVRDGWLTAVVLGRIFSKGLAYVWDNQTISSDGFQPVVNFSGSITIEAGCVRHFPGLKLPPSTLIDGNALYVPDNPNFPAVDFFVRCGNLVVAFAVHTSGHEDVGSTFWDLCRRAAWLQHDGKDKTMDLDLTILLVYLGPNKASQEAAMPHFVHGVVEGARARSDPFLKHIYVTSMCLEQFQDSLSTIVYEG